MTDSGALIRLGDVVKTFETPAGVFTALNGVSVTVGPGEFVAVIGKSGSGKTTLLNLITGIDRPTSGEIWVAGTPVHRLTENRIEETDGIIARGGTILGSSRTNPYKNADRDIPALRANFEALGLDVLVAIGGDDTLGVAHRLHNDFQLPMIGIPKTIDNDLMVTDFTFGFDTAINIVMEAVDRLRTTAESHRRVMVIETMGRHAGWIACLSGIAVAADYILIPEVPVNLDHMCGVLKRRRDEGKMYGLVVVSEGAQMPEGGAV